MSPEDRKHIILEVAGLAMETCRICDTHSTTCFTLLPRKKNKNEFRSNFKHVILLLFHKAQELDFSMP